jgi:hypothetical protein
MNSRSTSIFKDPNVAKHLSLLHDKYVIVSAENTPINIVFASTESTSILKLCFQFMDLDSRYLGPLANTSRI